MVVDTEWNFEEIEWDKCYEAEAEKADAEWEDI